MPVRSGARRARSVQQPRQVRSKDRQASSPRAAMRATRASDADMAGSARRRAAICAAARRYGVAATRRSADRTTEVASCAALVSSGVLHASNSCLAATALVSAARRGCGNDRRGPLRFEEVGSFEEVSLFEGVSREDLDARIVVAAEQGIQSRAALGQRGLHDDRGGILVRVGGSGQEPGAENGRGRRDGVP